MTDSRRWARWAWPAAALLLAALLVRHALWSVYNHDEIEHLHAAWLVAQGARPFVDFCEQHHPTLWYLLAPLAAHARSPHTLVVVARLVDLALLGALVAMWLRLARRIYKNVDTRCGALILVASFRFSQSMMLVRPDPWMTLGVFAGLDAWCAFLDGKRRRHAMLAGLWWGLAIAMLQKALAPVALAGGASLALGLARDRRRVLVGVALAAAGALLPIAALVGATARAGLLADFWFWNYPFNRFFYLEAPLAAHFSPWRTVGVSAAEDTLLWGFGLAGIALALRGMASQWRALDGAAQSRLVLATVALGSLAFLLVNRFPFEQYLLVPLPLLALFSVEIFTRAAGRLRLVARLAAAAMALVLGVSLVFFDEPNAPQRAFHDAILARTAATDTISIPPAHHPILRRDAGYFWYNAALLGDTYRALCRAHDCPSAPRAVEELAWRERAPRLVYLDKPDYWPLDWQTHAAGYAPTEIPGLLARVR